jgi:predicted N-formylglutamate amidohydrolase
MPAITPVSTKVRPRVNSSLSYSCPSCLGKTDPEPVQILNPASERGVLLIADHAGNAVPHSMKGLGLSAEDLTRHIAWDPGAAGVAAGLAQKWQATAVLAVYSRLIVDPNRPLGEASSMPAISDGTSVPANQDLNPEERIKRAELFYFPYHVAVETQLARLRRLSCLPPVVSIHSFTPDFQSEDRPWHIGVMAAADRRLAVGLIRNLRDQTGLEIGDNQPYSGVEYGYTLKIHAGAQGLANTQIEIRQDLLEDDQSISNWVNILDAALTPLMSDPDILRIEHH